MRERAVRGESLEPVRVRRILGQVLNGLEAAHSQSIVHRDVKPENIMLQTVAGNPDLVRILDFGLARFVEERTQTSVAMGTPIYMAPEQLDRRNIGPWTDLYVVGVMAFELLTGRRPFPGRTHREILGKKLDPDYDPCAQIADLDVSELSAEFFRRAVARSPEDRYRSATAFRMALANVFEAEQETRFLALGPRDFGGLVDSEDLQRRRQEKERAEAERRRRQEDYERRLAAEREAFEEERRRLADAPAAGPATPATGAERRPARPGTPRKIATVPEGADGEPARHVGLRMVPSGSDPSVAPAVEGRGPRAGTARGTPSGRQEPALPAADEGERTPPHPPESPPDGVAPPSSAPSGPPPTRRWLPLLLVVLGSVAAGAVGYALLAPGDGGGEGTTHQSADTGARPFGAVAGQGPPSIPRAPDPSVDPAADTSPGPTAPGDAETRGEVESHAAAPSAWQWGWNEWLGEWRFFVHAAPAGAQLLSWTCRRGPCIIDERDVTWHVDARREGVEGVRAAIALQAGRPVRLTLTAEQSRDAAILSLLQQCALSSGLALTLAEGGQDVSRLDLPSIVGGGRAAVLVQQVDDERAAELARLVLPDHLALGIRASEDLTDTGLAHLARLKGLRALSLSGTRVTDAGLAHLSGSGTLLAPHLSATNVTDSGMAHLATLAGVRELSSNGTRVTDAGRAHVAAMGSIRVLLLSDTRVSDAGLAQLAGRKSLRRLGLEDTKVSDAGLAHLAGMEGLAFLHLARTEVTDAGLAHAAGLESLRWLDLSATKVTDAGLAHLARAKRLLGLILSHTKVTDVGLVPVAGLDLLQRLDLSGTTVSDAGLVHLAGLQSLRVLRLDDTAVTDAGVASLGGLQQLETLGLDRTKVTDAGLG